MKTFSDKLGIHITRLGKAGHMTLLQKDNYITTDKAYIIFLKEEFKEKNFDKQMEETKEKEAEEEQEEKENVK